MKDHIDILFVCYVESQLLFLEQLFSIVAVSLGFSATSTQAFLKASILLSAAPALPLLLRQHDPCVCRGAVRPAIKVTTGFGCFSLAAYSAASSSRFPPISLIRTTAPVCGSFSKSFSTSMKFKPTMGLPLSQYSE
jgi:hypothetical protein